VKLFILISLLLLAGCESDYYAYFGNHGNAKVSISTSPAYLNWELSIKDIDLITMVHIHCLPGNYIGVTFNTAFNLITADGPTIKGSAVTPDKGNFCGWLRMEDVQSSIKAGNAYINIHTYAKPAGFVQSPLVHVSLLNPQRWGAFFNQLENRN
jgi:hypothetical protein